MHIKFSSIIPSVKDCLTFLTTHELNILIRMHWKFCNSNFGGGGGGGVQFNTLFTIFKSSVLRTQMVLCFLKR